MDKQRLETLICNYQSDKTADSSELFKEILRLAEIHIRYNNFHFSKEDKEDFLQNIAIIVIKYIDAYNPEISCFTTWLGIIVKRTYFTFYNKRKKEPVMIPTIMINPETEEEYNVLDDIKTSISAGDEYFQKYKKELICEALPKLKNEKYRMTIELRVLKEMKSKEIAEILHTSEKFVNVWYQRGTKQLGEIIREDIEDRTDDESQR